MKAARPERQTYPLILLILVQTACAVFFLSDVAADWVALGPRAMRDVHLGVEVLASLMLVIGIVFEARVLMHLLRRQARAERGLGIAAGALNDLMERYFHDWGLSAAEQDVAAFALKGFSIAEIAGLRGTREGTVKTHLNAIYRKAGVAGRSQLVSLLIEDLMTQPLVEGRATERAA